MWASFFIRFGMWAATVAVVFWIGWSVPASLDRDRDAGSSPLQVANAEGPSVQPVEAVAPQAGSLAMSLPSRPLVESKPLPRLGKVDLNRATIEDFESLPGIGPVLAERIVEYRKTKGAFRTVGDLRLVKGIGKKKFERVRQLVSVSPGAKLPGRGNQHT